MKKLFYLLFCISLLFACKKDNTIPEDIKRIKQITFSDNAITGAIKIYYNYDNNLLVNRTVMAKSNSSYNTWDTTIKCDYTYSGDIVTAISYLGDEGELHLGEKAEYEFTDTQMSNMKYFEFVDGEFISRYEYVFNFNGELLESFDFYAEIDENGILYKISRGEYTYEGQNVIKFRVKDLYDNEYFYNEDFVYKNGLLDNWISSKLMWITGIWKNQEKEEYDYNSNNLLEKKRVYDWTNYWSYSYSVTFQYNQDNLIKEDYSDNTNGLNIEYIYEDEPGNSELLLFTPIDRVYNNQIIENIYDGSLDLKFKNKLSK